MKIIVLVAACAAVAFAGDSFESTGIRIALKIYDDCSKADAFSSCLKKKAITFLDRLGRMERFNLGENIIVSRASDVTSEPSLSEEQLETTLPRASDAQDQALNSMLFDKATKFISTRSIEVTLPKLNELVEEGRGKKMKGMMGGMMMGVAAKMAALIPIAIAGLFLLAGKALITAKIALLISGIIAIKKLFAAKHGGGGGGGHGWQSGGGGGGGWQSSGGGWDKRSLDTAQELAYKAYSPK